MSENALTNPTLAVSLTVKDAAEALDFYTRAFNAKELYRLDAPDGSVCHAEFMLGNTKVFISGEAPEMSALAMPEGVMASCLLCIEVDDCDTAHKQAVDAGAKSMTEPKDEVWGQRASMVLDPFGYRWGIGHEIEKVSPEELADRVAKLYDLIP